MYNEQLVKSIYTKYGHTTHNSTDWPDSSQNALSLNEYKTLEFEVLQLFNDQKDEMFQSYSNGIELNGCAIPCDDAKCEM